MAVEIIARAKPLYFNSSSYFRSQVPAKFSGYLKSDNWPFANVENFSLMKSLTSLSVIFDSSGAFFIVLGGLIIYLQQRKTNFQRLRKT